MANGRVGELLNRYPTEDAKQEYGNTNAIEVIKL